MPLNKTVKCYKHFDVPSWLFEAACISNSSHTNSKVFKGSLNLLMQSICSRNDFPLEKNKPQRLSFHARPPSQALYKAENSYLKLCPYLLLPLHHPNSSHPSLSCLLRQSHYSRGWPWTRNTPHPSSWAEGLNTHHQDWLQILSPFSLESVSYSIAQACLSPWL